MARYDLPIPSGWFEVAEVSELAPGQLKQVEAFNEKLVLWRGHDGTFHLNEGYCPHQGAAFAVGGVVTADNRLGCPFHGWQFGAGGALENIPYAPNASTSACLRDYPVQEYHGLVMGWFDAAGAAPAWELPEIPELDGGGLTGPLVETHLLKTHLQEMAENVVDGAHFETIHKHPGPASYDHISFDGHMMTAQTTQMFPGSKGPVEGRLDMAVYGMGASVLKYQTLIDLVVLNVTRPITSELSQMRLMVYYENQEGDPRCDRIANAFKDEVNRQVREDQPIWENKVYKAKPVLTEGEAIVTRFRAWCRQFYGTAA